MFTGIVRERGVVVAVENGRLTVDSPMTASDSDLGDSVAISGVCLTVVGIERDHLAFDVVPETLARSSLGRLRAGDEVNVEPALRGDDRLGGHFVQGHVDAVGSIRSTEPEGEGRRVWIEAPPDVLRYCVEKGSITVQGVALTIAELADDAFAVALIPYTLAETTLGALEPGAQVNLEADVLAKYVERLVLPR
jgi:riboflavin synthase